MRQNLVTVGRVGAPHGIRGELKLQTFLEDPDNLLRFDDWYIQFPQKSDFVAFKDFEIHEKGVQFYIAFKGVTDRDQARQFTHALLAIPRESLPQLDAEEFYWSDLEGLSVYDQNGTLLGVVDYLMETGANDVLIVKNVEKREILIPYVYGEIIRHVDLPAKKIVVDWEPL